MIPPVSAVALPTPSVKSIRKKRTEKSCGTKSNLAIASGYEMKASPGPLFTTSCTGTFNSAARLPRIENIVNPATAMQIKRVKYGVT